MDFALKLTNANHLRFDGEFCKANNVIALIYSVRHEKRFSKAVEIIFEIRLRVRQPDKPEIKRSRISTFNVSLVTSFIAQVLFKLITNKIKSFCLSYTPDLIINIQK